eukprot:455992-Rhodomonas_salina.1
MSRRCPSAPPPAALNRPRHDWSPSARRRCFLHAMRGRDLQCRASADHEVCCSQVPLTAMQ